jgi:hypothetical protein
VPDPEQLEPLEFTPAWALANVRAEEVDIDAPYDEDDPNRAHLVVRVAWAINYADHGDTSPRATFTEMADEERAALYVRAAAAIDAVRTHGPRFPPPLSPDEEALIEALTQEEMHSARSRPSRTDGARRTRRGGPVPEPAAMTCISDRFPRAALDAMIHAARSPGHDDGHTDCYYAGLLAAALPHLLTEGMVARGARAFAEGFSNPSHPCRTNPCDECLDDARRVLCAALLEDQDG